jgi:hypothetical protein
MLTFAWTAEPLDRKGDSKLGYNFTAGLFICWQIQRDTKSMSSCLHTVWRKEKLYTHAAAF